MGRVAFYPVGYTGQIDKPKFYILFFPVVCELPKVDMISF